MKLCLIIPAYNEQFRIKRTLESYYYLFSESANAMTAGFDQFEIIIVPNGCKDDTLSVAQEFQKNNSGVFIVECPHAGKGIAIAAGMHNALQRDNTIIGFVDADMATEPVDFLALVKKYFVHKNVIASRYMPGASIYPQRPFIKRWGSRFVYEPLIHMLLGLQYYDMQCGAKIFSRATVEKVLPHLSVRGWAFDSEFLYLCKKHGFPVTEVPTVWTDQKGSKLSPLRSGFIMLYDIWTIWKKHR